MPSSLLARKWRALPALPQCAERTRLPSTGAERSQRALGFFDPLEFFGAAWGFIDSLHYPSGSMPRAYRARLATSAARRHSTWRAVLPCAPRTCMQRWAIVSAHETLAGSVVIGGAKKLQEGYMNFCIVSFGRITPKPPSTAPGELRSRCRGLQVAESAPARRPHPSRPPRPVRSWSTTSPPSSRRWSDPGRSRVGRS